MQSTILPAIAALECQEDGGGAVFAFVMGAVSVAVAAQLTAQTASFSDRIRILTRDSVWKRVAAIPIGFPTYHPQGMVKIGDTIFVSSVEVTVPTKRFAQPTDGFDRDTGQGVGHLFKTIGNIRAVSRLA